MKIPKLLLLLLILPFSSLFAQDEDLDNLPFDEQPLQEITRPYFVLGGGFTTNFYMPKMDAINSMVKSMGLDEFSGPMYQYGGQGMTGVPQLENFRFGFAAQGGLQTVSKVIDTTIAAQLYKQNRNVDFAVSSAGFNIGYGFVPVKTLAIVPEIQIGWGQVSIETYQSVDGKDYNWGTDYASNADALTYMKRASSTFTYVQPALNIEYAVTEFLMFRANVNYTQSFGWDWKMNRTGTFKDFKTDDINSNGLGVQLGIFLGLFNY